MLHIANLELGHHLAAALHVKHGIGEDATEVPLVEDDESEIRIRLGDTSRESRLKSRTGTLALFQIFKAGDLRVDLGHALIRESELLLLVGHSGFSSLLLRRQFIHLRKELLEVTRFGDLIFKSRQLLGDFFQLLLEDVHLSDLLIHVGLDLGNLGLQFITLLFDFYQLLFAASLGLSTLGKSLLGFIQIILSTLGLLLFGLEGRLILKAGPHTDAKGDGCEAGENFPKHGGKECG